MTEIIQSVYATSGDSPYPGRTYQTLNIFGLPFITYFAAGDGEDDAAPLRAIIADITTPTRILLPSDKYEFRTVDANNDCVGINQNGIWFIGKNPDWSGIGSDPGTGGTTAILAYGPAVLGATTASLFHWYADEGSNTTDNSDVINGGGLVGLSVTGQGGAKYAVNIGGGVVGLTFTNCHLAHTGGDSVVILGTGVTHSGGHHTWHSTWDHIFTGCVIRSFNAVNAIRVTGNPNVAGGENTYFSTFDSCIVSAGGSGAGLYAEDCDDIFIYAGSVGSTTGASIDYLAPTATKTGGGGRGVYLGGVHGVLPDAILRTGVGTGNSARNDVVIGGMTEDLTGIPTMEAGANLWYADDWGRHNFRPDIRTGVQYTDDFARGGTTSSGIGDLGWYLNNGSCALLASEVEHPGLRRISSTAVATTVALMSLVGSGSVGTFVAEETFWLSYIFRLNQVDTDTMMRIGLGMSYTGNPPNHGIYLEKLYADTNWFAVCRAGGVETRTDMGTAVGTGWNRLVIKRRNATTIGFSFGDVTNYGDTITIATNVPATGQNLNPIMQIQTQAAAEKTFDIDTFQLFVNGLNRA